MVRQADFFRPLDERLRAAERSHAAIATAVSCLLPLGCPSAILRGIVAIIVYAINGMLRRWLLPHVCKKVLEPLPTFAYSDSTITVELIRLSAPRVHKCPDNVFRRSGLAVRQVSVSCLFGAIASATFRGTRPKIIGCHMPDGSTIAPAFPVRKPATPFIELQSCPTIEPSAGNVFVDSHGVTITQSA